jgi:hypothetical protein
MKTAVSNTGILRFAKSRARPAHPRFRAVPAENARGRFRASFTGPSVGGFSLKRPAPSCSAVFNRADPDPHINPRPTTPAARRKSRSFKFGGLLWNTGAQESRPNRAAARFHA